MFELTYIHVKRICLTCSIALLNSNTLNNYVFLAILIISSIIWKCCFKTKCRYFCIPKGVKFNFVMEFFTNYIPTVREIQANVCLHQRNDRYHFTYVVFKVAFFYSKNLIYKMRLHNVKDPMFYLNNHGMDFIHTFFTRCFYAK